MKRGLLLLAIAIGCGGAKAAPPASNTNHAAGSAAVSQPASEDCLQGGMLLRVDNPSVGECPFIAEVMGPAKPDGSITMLKCCYKTANTACAAGGCEVAMCDVGEKPGSKVTCKDTTHGGVPTNP